MRPLLLLLQISILHFATAQYYPFTLSLKEQPSEENDQNQKFLLFDTKMTCGDSDCVYAITVSNFGFYQILVNNRQCPSNICEGRFFRHQTVNVTVYKSSGEYIKLFDLTFDAEPNIVVLGCEKGYVTDKSCTKISETVLKVGGVEDSYYDEVCVCSQTSDTCDKKTPEGTCTIGKTKWWDSIRDSSSPTTSLATTTSPSAWSYPIDDITVSFQETLTNSGPSNIQDVIVTAYLNCTIVNCYYKTTVINNNPSNYTVYVGNDECSQPTCAGNFLIGHSAAVIIQRVGHPKAVEILTYQWKDLFHNPQILVLGCDAGLVLVDTCQQIYNQPLVDNQYYNDVVCSCQGKTAMCKDTSPVSMCVDGSLVWWVDHVDPHSTFPTQSTLATTTTTTLPPENPNVFDLTFFLFEGVYGGNPDEDNNVTVTLAMNCSDTACQYTVRIVDYAQTYYTVRVNGKECPGSVCSDSFLQSYHVPVTVTRVSEQLTLFDMEFVEFPNVKVLGCTYGMFKYGKCRSAQYYDTVIQRDDHMCICQNSEMQCDGGTHPGICSDDNPTWWQPILTLSSTSTVSTSTVSTSTVLTTTPTPYSISFDVNLHETVKAGTESITIHTNMVCSDSACSFHTTIVNSNPEYFGISVDTFENCDESCEGSFTDSEERHAHVYRLGGEMLEVFALKFQDVVVLNCTQGWLIPGKCILALNGNDEVCTCRDVASYCDDVKQSTSCSSGTPTWWQPDPRFTHSSSTEPSTSVATTTPPSPSNQYTTVKVTLNEELSNTQDHKIVMVTAAMNCTTKNICNYGATVDNQNPDYYTVLENGLQFVSPLHVTLKYGDPAVIISVHRLQEHLDFIEFQVTDDGPQLLVMGCQSMQNDGSGLIDTTGNCLHIFKTSYNGGFYYIDDVCLCKGDADNCDDTAAVGKCSSGAVTWWEKDQSTSLATTTVTTTTGPTTTATTTTTTPTTTTTVTTTTTATTTTTPKPTTTTTYDLLNKFSFEISLAEGRNNKKHQVTISSDMSCTVADCSYSIKVENSAEAWFKVYVANEPCQNKKCSGSFMKSSSVNVTVYREDQILDLFDFEFTDTPRIVVLGCEDGLSEFGNCIRISEVTKIEGEDYVDEVCSCRSAQVDCKIGKGGVCTKGAQKWWKDVVGSSSTTVVTTDMGTSSSTVTPTTPATMPSLQDLSDGGVGLNNVTQVLNDTNHYSQQGPALNRTQIFDITKILHNSANLPGITKENALQILQNMDHVLNAHQKEIRNGQSKEFRLLSVLLPMVKNTKDKLIQYLGGRNLGFNAKQVNCNTETHTDDGLIDYGPDKGFAVLNDTNKLSATSENSIIVPLGTVCGSQQVSHVFFTIYRHQKLFSGPQKYRSYGGEDTEPTSQSLSKRDKRHVVLNEDDADTISQIPAPSRCTRQVSIPPVPVMSATLMAGDTVVKTFAAQDDSRPGVIAKLQFNTGKQWSLQEQCKMESDENGIVTASCEHLTDFTVLIDGQIDAEYVCSWPLIIIGYSVNGASIVCLLALILIGSLVYLRYNNLQKILSYIRGQAQTSGDIVSLAYHCIFFMFFILSLFFMDQSSDDINEPITTTTYCVVIAAMSYFSLISAIMISMLIGIRMVCHFFSPKLRAFFGVMTSPPAALSIGLVIPFTLTIMLAIFDTPFFERNDSFCWVRPDYIAYAVVVPVVLPIINGTICSSFAIYKMFFQAKRGLASKEASHYDAEFWSKILGLIIMQFAMGLPWGIEFIVIGVTGSSAWNYVFVILLGTQGIDLFLIFLYRRQRLVNESRKWSAREEKMERKKYSNTVVVEE
ncbi:hypothetical protein GCK72_003917 [Caenorhabditis remanei]|uniref:GPS domain-containing protein n=1 Tax=Caenorhabditis remanei TaxID=31234 RepID=A0A6A5HAS8_CAERE|nr:hypothetical protein GCK72_003917 [Caenorhabditis remanei]KAF1763971.1 hypothetical protein GCK72_003917 [Caenorhabditis remanei]